MSHTNYRQEDANYVPMSPPPTKPVAAEIRGISIGTYKKYHVVHDEKGNLLFPYDDRRNKQLKAYKTRLLPFSPNPEKVMPWIGSYKNTSLFGHGRVSSRVCILTFGEFDAMSAHQMTGYASECPINDDAAAGHINANLEGLLTFEVIYVVPDNDESGRETLEQILEVLPLEKLKIVRLPDDVKDVNDMLRLGRVEEFKKCLWAGTAPELQFIITPREIAERTDKLLDNPDAFVGFPTGIEAYDDLVGGVRPGEIVVIGGKTSMGKSALARCLLYRLRGKRVLWCGYEGRQEIDNMSFASQFHKRSIVDMAIEGKIEQVRPLVKEWNALSNIDFSYNRVESFKKYLVQLRQAVVMRGYRVIAIDHLHYMANTMQSHSERHMNEIEAIQTFMLQLHELAVEMDFGVLLVSHMARNKDSKGVERVETNIEDYHGSSAIEKYCDVGLAIFGEKYNPEVTVRVGKNRLLGRRGVGDIFLTYQQWGDYK